METVTEGKRRQFLTIAVLIVTLLIGIATLYGIISYPVRLDNRLGNIENRQTRLEALAEGNAARLKLVEDYKAETKGKLDLIIYQQGENKDRLDKIVQRLNLTP